MRNDQLRVLRADFEAGHLRASEVSFQEFDACGPPYFYGSRDWWCEVVQGLEPDVVESMSSEDFVTSVKREFEQLTHEDLMLVHDTEIVTEITANFKEKVMFCPQYVTSEEMWMTRCHDILRTEIREDVSISSHKTLSSLVEVVRERVGI